MIESNDDLAMKLAGILRTHPWIFRIGLAVACLIWLGVGSVWILHGERVWGAVWLVGVGITIGTSTFGIRRLAKNLESRERNLDRSVGVDRGGRPNRPAVEIPGGSAGLVGKLRAIAASVRFLPFTVAVWIVFLVAPSSPVAFIAIAGSGVALTIMFNEASDVVTAGWKAAYPPPRDRGQVLYELSHLRVRYAARRSGLPPRPLEVAWYVSLAGIVVGVASYLVVAFVFCDSVCQSGG